jgi:D-alanyl-D-alanine carboxypeptidase/D-alanyl-D-alanine-endopeptidase (penicillin-binding protein 4)
MRSAGYQVAKVETDRVDYLSRYSPNVQSAPHRVGNTIFTRASRPLKEIVREVNVESNNHYAEHLIRTVGRRGDSNIYSDALEEGIKQTLKYWDEIGLDTTPLLMYDGSGLAPQNAVSARFLTDLLVYMHNRSDCSTAFFQSLPKAGQEGTLQNFLRGTRLNGKVMAKSGSIGGVQCYAGYLIDGNKRYAFAILVNKFNGTRTQVGTVIEQLLLGL